MHSIGLDFHARESTPHLCQFIDGLIQFSHWLSEYKWWLLICKKMRVVVDDDVATVAAK